MTLPLRGVLLDVGGVLLIPDGDVVGAALREAGIDHHPDYERAHYVGVAAFDSARDVEDKVAYLSGYVSVLGADETAIEVLLAVWESPGLDLWRSVVVESIVGLRRLSDSGLPLGIVSNSDGTVEDQLRVAEICQVGAGLGVPVLAIVDSALVGVAKPEPEAFSPAIDALGLDPASIAFVGDSVRADVDGAAAAGLHPFHFDPFKLCTDRTHEHVAAVADVVAASAR